MDDIERLKSYGLHFGDDEPQPRQLSEEAIEWGNKQVTRILSEKVAALEAALQWYADSSNWVFYYDTDFEDNVTNAEKDGGERARKALEGGS